MALAPAAANAISKMGCQSDLGNQTFLGLSCFTLRSDYVHCILLEYKDGCLYTLGRVIVFLKWKYKSCIRSDFHNPHAFLN